MALIVETGNGLADAESYISIADADTYFLNRGITAWSGSDHHKEEALRRATDYMEGRYYGQWKGQRKYPEQALAWPRVEVFDTDGYEISDSSVPVQVKRACAEYAMRALTATLLPDETAPGITSESVSIPGPISKSVSYSGTKTTMSVYYAVDRILRPVLIPSDSMERS
jgi:hypothetical protein